MNEKSLSWFSGIGLILVTMIWGVAFVVVKNSLDALPAIYLIAFRFTIASLGLCIIFFKKILTIPKQTLIHGCLIGVNLCLAYIFQTVGLKYTTAGNNAFLTTIYVMIVPFINWILTKRRPDIFSIVAAIIAIIGLALLSLKDNLSMNIGDILTIICGFCFALQIAFIAKYSQKDDPVLLAIIQIFVTAVISWIVAPFVDGKFPIEQIQNPTVIGNVLFLGLLSTMVCFLLQNVCQKHLPSSTAALLMSFEAVFGLLSGVVFLHETMPAKGWIGCGLMFLAVITSETKFSFLRKTK